MSIEVGSKLKGKVTGITHFGAFVQLPNGKTGLVHISEVAHNYVKDIKDHLKIGEQVEVKIVQVEKDGKIGLSIKRAMDPPVQRNHKSGKSRRGGASTSTNRTLNFEDQLSRFLKDSEERLSTLKRHTESKRGGRGSRRS
ncbi:S1 domain-containing RNA-binding protein [Pueribacillus sp. YX66]|uniref:S1 domain-containing RNA-binding protein n=1 Tax=Pueribacillus sp. YX66 TaxID=3229242 RepID=UPI00358D8EE3